MASNNASFVGKWRYSVPTPDPGAFRDHVDGHRDALGREDLLRCLEDPRTVADRIGAHRAAGTDDVVYVRHGFSLIDRRHLILSERARQANSGSV